MFHPRKAAAFRNAFIQGVVHTGTERLPIIRAETGDRFTVQSDFADGFEHKSVDFSRRSLRHRIERADGFQLVPEQIQP